MGALADFRRQYPQYDDMSDVELADALHRKYYSDLPKEEVFKRLSVNPQADAAPAPVPAQAMRAAPQGTLTQAPLKDPGGFAMPWDYFTDRKAAIERDRAQRAYIQDKMQRSELEDMQTQTGFFDRLGDLFSRGLLSARSGIKDVEAAIETDPTLQRQFQQEARRFAADRGVEISGATTEQDVKDNFLRNVIPYIIEKGAESLPQMIASTNPLGVLGVALPSNLGGQAREAAELQGRQDVSGTDVARVAPGALAVTALDTLGLGGILATPARTALGRIGKAALIEGGTEAIQSAIEYANPRVVAGSDIDAGELFEQAAFGALAGGGIGGGLRGTGEIATAVLQRGKAEATNKTPTADSPEVEQEYLRLVTEQSQALREANPGMTQRQAYNQVIKDAGKLYDTAITNTLFGAEEGGADVAADVGTAVDVSGRGGAGVAPAVEPAPSEPGAPELGETVAGRVGEPVPSVPVSAAGEGAGEPALSAGQFDPATLPIYEASTITERKAAAKPVINDIIDANYGDVVVPAKLTNQIATQMAQRAARKEVFNPTEIVQSVLTENGIAPAAPTTAVEGELAAQDQEVSQEMLAPEVQTEPTVAETATVEKVAPEVPVEAPAPFTATPAKAETTRENYAGPLSNWTPKLFRETSTDQLELFLPTGNTSKDMSPELFMADTPELALGQGNNTGVLMEFDADKLEGNLSKAKPTWEFGLTEGTGSEFIAKRNQQSAYKDALSGVRIAKDAKITKVQRERLGRVLKALEASGWSKADTDSYIEYTRPAITPAPAPEAAAPTPEAAAPTPEAVAPPGAPPTPPTPPATPAAAAPAPAPKKPTVVSKGKPVVLTEAQTRTALEKAKAYREKMNRIQKRIAATNDTADVLSGGVELAKLARGDEENWALLRGAVDTLDVGKWQLILPTLSTEDIFRILKDRIPGLTEADRIIRQDVTRFQTKEYLQLSQQLEQVAEFLKKYPKAAQALSDLEFATVAYQVDPTLANSAEEYFAKVDQKAKEIRDKIKAEKDPKKKARLQAKLKTRSNEIESIYKGVPGGERVIGWRDLSRPEFGGGKGREIFKLLRDAHRRDLEAKYNALRSRLMETKEEEALDEALEKLEEQFKPAREQVIYFPAMRFGSYYARVGSGANSIFKMFDTETKRNQFVRVMEARAKAAQDPEQYKVTDTGNVEDLRNQFGQVTGGPLKEVLDLFDDNPKDIGALKSQVFDLWLQTMSSGDMRKHMAPRKMRAGYSTDILKNFANFRRSSINDVKRAQFGYKLRNEISRARDMTKEMPDRAKLDAFTKEIELRTLGDLMPPDRSNPYWEAAIQLGNKAAFYQYLANPKTALIQLTQLHIVALPMLAQKYGSAKATAALSKYGFSSLGGFVVSPLKAIKREDGSFTFDWEQPNLLDNPVSALKEESDPELYEVLSEGWQEGRDLNLYMDTFANQIGGYGNADPNQRSALQELMRGRVHTAAWRGTTFALEAMGTLMHQMERVNREATYMAALELGYRENRKKGQTHAEAKKNAIEAAVDTTLAATFDFSSYNKPRALTTGAGRLAGQFMSYPYMMTSLLARKLYTAIKVGELEPGERKAATQTATGALVNLGLYAGLTGVPLYGLFTTIASLLLWASDDDDEEEGGLSYIDKDGNLKATYDVDWWFRNVWIPKTFGPDGTAANLFGYDDETAEVVARSVEKGPISAITDVDLSNSVALDFLFFLPKESRAETAEGQLKDYTFSMLTGAFGNTVMDYEKARQDLMNGYTNRALEKLPRLFGNVAKANRFAGEGQLNYNRELVGMDKDFWASDKAILQGLGFASTEADQRQQQNYEAKSINVKVEKAREDMLAKVRRVALDTYQYGYTPEVAAERQTVMEEWSKFNQTYPTHVIGVDTLFEVQINAVNGARRSQVTRGVPMDEKGKTPYLRDTLRRRIESEEK